MLVAMLVTGCSNSWTLVAEGVLTNYSEIADQAVLTFDGDVMILLGAYTLEEPKILILGMYYYLYKEDGGKIWNGYHLLVNRR